MAIHRRTSALLALLATLVLVPAGSAAAQDRTIVVIGTATQEVPNDTASIGLSVGKERRSKAATLRIVSIRLRAVIAAVQGTPGVGAGDVTTGEISLRKVARDGRTLWRASEGIAVILHQPEQAGTLISAAVAAGATGTRGPSFFPGDPETAYTNVLLAAFDQARAKASALATRAGAILGPAISIEEGANVVPSTPKSKATTPESSPPVKPGGSTVTATVRVVFALE